jgi:hypothetical protein
VKSRLGQWDGNMARIQIQIMKKRILVGKPSENVHVEETEGNWKITLRKIL